MACCVRGCKNRPSAEPKLHFHRFPANQKLREIWLRAVGRKDLLGRKKQHGSRRICSAHFITGKKSKNPQHPDYVPSVFTFRNESKRMTAREVRSLIRQEKKKVAEAAANAVDEDLAEHQQGGVISDPNLVLEMVKAHVAQMMLKKKMYDPLDDDDIIPFIYNPEEEFDQFIHRPAEGAPEASQTKDSQSNDSPAQSSGGGQLIYITEDGRSDLISFTFHSVEGSTEPAIQITSGQAVENVRHDHTYSQPAMVDPVQSQLEKTSENTEGETNAVPAPNTGQPHTEEETNEEPAPNTNQSHTEVETNATPNTERPRGQNNTPHIHDRFCSVCEVFYISLETFLTQFETELDKRFRCRVCDKKFTCKTPLQVHKWIHTESPFSCSTCDQRFVQMNALNTHQLKHTEAKFQCSLCPKKFKDESRLETHRIGHKNHSKETAPTKLKNLKGTVPKRQRKNCKEATSTRQKENLKEAESLRKKRKLSAQLSRGDVSSSIEGRPLEKEQNDFEPPEMTKSPKEKGKPKSKPQCPVCKKLFSKPYLLKNHMSIHTGERLFQCPSCPKRFREKSNLAIHSRVHTGERPYMCSYCGDSFKLSYTLKAHIACKHTGKAFECGDCGRKFSTRAKLNFHSKNHSQEKDKLYSCSVCMEAFRTSKTAEEHLQVHKQETESEPKVDPDKIFVKYSGALYLCSQCGKTFNMKVNLNNHMMTHSKERPFLCSVCGLTFKTNLSLNTHMMLHTGEKPFSCSICPETFRTKPAMTQHMFFHTGDKPFSCDVCGAKFCQKSSLKVHSLMHSGERPFACPLCAKRYKGTQALNHHMRVMHKMKDNACPICDKPFMSEQSLNMHMGRKHFMPHIEENTAATGEHKIEVLSTGNDHCAIGSRSLHSPESESAAESVINNA